MILIIKIIQIQLSQLKDLFALQKTSFPVTLKPVYVIGPKTRATILTGSVKVAPPTYFGRDRLGTTQKEQLQVI